MFKKRIMKYYYDAQTGVFQGASFNANPINFENYPYIQREEFRYSDYRVNISTGELIHEPLPIGPRR